MASSGKMSNGFVQSFLQTCPFAPYDVKLPNDKKAEIIGQCPAESNGRLSNCEYAQVNRNVPMIYGDYLMVSVLK